MPQLVLIRGLPGSGKSTLAKEYTARGFLHFEADMYFVSPDGIYEFDASRIKDAHSWCQQRTLAALRGGKDVVVTNTFVKRWEMIAYENMAKETGATIEVIVATGMWSNVHGVPAEALERMRANWED